MDDNDYDYYYDCYYDYDFYYYYYYYYYYYGMLFFVHLSVFTLSHSDNQSSPLDVFSGRIFTYYAYPIFYCAKLQCL